MLESIKNIPAALTSPASFFKEEKAFSGSAFLLMFLYSLMIFTTSLASQKVMNTEGFREFQVDAGYKQAVKMNPSLTEMDKEELRNEIRAQMEKPLQRTIQSVATAIGSFMSILGILIFWLFIVIFFRFAGAEESPIDKVKKNETKTKKHRRSLFLAAFAFLPLGLSALTTAVILLLRDPDYFLNMLTLQDIMDKMNLAPSIYSLLFDGSLPLWPELFLNIFTNPFYWWFGYIVAAGGESVLRIPPRKSIILTVIYLVLLVNYQWGTMSIANAFTG